MRRLRSIRPGRCLPCRSETHWPDGAPKRFRGKDAWKSWINWESPFNGSSDQLNRERKFFWEVDDKGALWRLELHEPGRWGEMRHPKVVDEFFGHLQRNRTGDFEDFPFVSMKTHEHYYVRWASDLARATREAPIVFNDLCDGVLVHWIRGSEELSRSISTAFDPTQLRLIHGRLLHPVSVNSHARAGSLSGTIRKRETFLASIDVTTSQRILSLCEESEDVSSGLLITWENERVPVLMEE